MNVDVKVPLYIICIRCVDLLGNNILLPLLFQFEGYVLTNSRFTPEAINYAKCKQLKLISWNYAESNSLSDRRGLYSLTCLTTIPHAEEQWLLSNNLVLVKEIC
jgi:hypothetical protein